MEQLTEHLMQQLIIVGCFGFLAGVVCGFYMSLEIKNEPKQTRVRRAPNNDIIFTFQDRDVYSHLRFYDFQ